MLTDASYEAWYKSEFRVCEIETKHIVLIVTS